ncbi:MAG TPA: phage baseplate assembly protein V, partial [Sphingomonadaceae bacterium]|nr:phage baseplate assembly protein V [Sphingomonadaceae bacterium]
MRPDGDARGLGDLIRFGTIASVDLAAARCTVAAGDLITGPIRWIEPRAGATRSWAPPSVGEQVLLICPEGEIAAGVALRGVSCATYPPAGDSARELIVYDDGAVLAYDPEGHALEALLPAGGTVRLVAPGGIAIEGNVAITGDLTISGDATASGISLV